MSRNVLQAYPERVAKPLPISQGGTGAKTPAAAIANLNGIDIARVGATNGIAPLNSNTKIPLQYLPAPDVNSVSVTGPSTCYITQTVIFTITDFDFDTVYDLSCSSGTIMRSHAEISFTPAALGAQHFTIRDQVYDVEVKPSIVAKPTLLLTENSYIFNEPTIVGGSPYTLDGINLTYSGIEYQIASDALFTNIVGTAVVAADVDNNADTPTFTIVFPGGMYGYLRIRYNSINPILAISHSDWSDGVRIIFDDYVIPRVAKPILTHTDIPVSTANTWTGDEYGTSKALSIDGQLLIIGDPTSDGFTDPAIPAVGLVYVYQWLNGAWSELDRIACPDQLEDQHFGYYVYLSTDKQTLVISTYTYSNLHNKIYVYKIVTLNDYTSYTLVDSYEPSIISPNTTLPEYFGSYLWVSKNCEYIISTTKEAGNDLDNDLYIGAKNHIHFLHFDGNNITVENIIETTDNEHIVQIDISHDNQKLLMRTNVKTNPGYVKIDIYIRYNNQWTHDETIDLRNFLSTERAKYLDIMPNAVLFLQDSNNILYSDYGDDTLTQQDYNPCKIYYLEKINNIWTLKQQFNLFGSYNVTTSNTYAVSGVVSSDGLCCVLGIPYGNNTLLPSGGVPGGGNVGCIVLYKRHSVNDNWVYANSYEPDVLLSEEYFGDVITIDGICETIVTSTSYQEPPLRNKISTFKTT